MKRILSTALAIALFVGAAQAQNTEDKGRHHDDRKEQAMEQLNLTADQKAKLQSIREAQQKEMQELQKNDQITVAEMKQKRQALQEKYKAQYRAVLTPAQAEELKKNKPERGERSFGKKGGDQFRNQAAFFKKELNLTNDQETRIKGIFQEFQSKAQALRSNNSLTQEQKKEQMHTLAKQYMDQGKAVLTPEQLKKFDEVKANRKHQKNTNL